jgi:hypothetical protein
MLKSMSDADAGQGMRQGRERTTATNREGRMMTTYGTTQVDGNTYQLTTDADYTNRLLPAAYVNYHEANDGESYDFEMSAYAEDAGGNHVIVYWLFEGLKGDDDPELDTYDYSTADRIEAL